MAKKYIWVRMWKETKETWDNRLKKINENDLPQIGIKEKKIPMTTFMDFQAKTRFYISDSELKKMAKRKFGGKIC